jgi:hypothetical protein
MTFIESVADCNLQTAGHVTPWKNHCRAHDWWDILTQTTQGKRQFRRPKCRRHDNNKINKYVVKIKLDSSR